MSMKILKELSRDHLSSQGMPPKHSKKWVNYLEKEDASKQGCKNNFDGVKKNKKLNLHCLDAKLDLSDYFLSIITKHGLSYPFLTLLKQKPLRTID